MLKDIGRVRGICERLIIKGCGVLMSKKKQNQIRVSFVGMSSEDVTGSMTLIEMDKKKILLECGLFQSNNMKKDFQINSRKLPFKPKEIDYVFINHAHIDHTGLLPRLYAEGSKAKIIAVRDTSSILSILLKDSAFIMERDLVKLNKNSDITFKPIYTIDNVERCLNSIREFEHNILYELDDEISFEFIPAGHIVKSAQLLLCLKQGNSTRKILYTSDIGNIKVNKFYTEPFERVDHANLVIGECTYSNNKRTVKAKDRQNDLDKIKTVIEDVCIERKGKVLIPSFALDRCQNIVTHLYNLFGHDENFNIPVIIDSPMAVAITKTYGEILDGEDKLLFDRVMSWKNLKLVSESEDSKTSVSSKDPAIICSSSGMLTAGRSIYYVKSILPDSRSTILFIGFASENSLANKIKEGYKNKTITIDGKAYSNRCQIVDLKSFTSHMQHDDLLDYYSSINCEKIALVHSNFNDKVLFCKELQDAIADKNRTSKVICVNKSTSIII